MRLDHTLIRILMPRYLASGPHLISPGNVGYLIPKFGIPNVQRIPDEDPHEQYPNFHHTPKAITLRYIGGILPTSWSVYTVKSPACCLRDSSVLENRPRTEICIQIVTGRVVPAYYRNTSGNFIRSDWSISHPKNGVQANPQFAYPTCTRTHIYL